MPKHITHVLGIIYKFSKEKKKLRHSARETTLSRATLLMNRPCLTLKQNRNVFGFFLDFSSDFFFSKVETIAMRGRLHTTQYYLSNETIFFRKYFVKKKMRGGHNIKFQTIQIPLQKKYKANLKSLSLLKISRKIKIQFETQQDRWLQIL